MRLHDPDRRGFASDNYAGAHPAVLAAVAEANGGHQTAYGDDAYTRRLGEVVREHFGSRAEVFPVFNGTGANVTALMAMLPRWGAVITTDSSHLHTDENAAPERVGGLKVLTVEAPDGRLTPDSVDRQAWGWGDEHRAQPLAVSITQSTEVGTLYRPQEIRALADHAHALGMSLHMDGARLANAAAALDVPLRALTTDAGVDVLSFGGTKNGALYGELVLVLDPDAATGLTYLRKLTMQLGSKLRFVSAQMLALFADDLYLRTAGHANAMATLLRERLDALLAAGAIDGLRFTQPTEANAVFAVLDPVAAERLRAAFDFHTWNQAIGEVRWMTAFDTTPEDVDAFVAAIAAELATTRG